MPFQRRTAKQRRWIGCDRISHSGKHGNVRRTIGKRARFLKVEPFVFSVFLNAAFFLFFREKWWNDATGRHVILEFESIADHFIDSKMQRNGPYLKVQC